MSTSIKRVAAAVAALGFASGALACGICDEDRVAAVFDHASVRDAVAAKRQVAFFAIDGSLPATADARRAVTAALYAGGAVKGSARVSLESASTSAVFDPRKTSVESLQAAASAKLAPRRLSLSPLRVVDR
jgi:hypothetical protein